MDGIDLTDLDLFADGFPHDVFARHRAEAPVFWHEPTEHTPDGEGFWSVATHAEVLAVLHDPATYSSETGGDRTGRGTLLQDLDVAGLVPRRQSRPPGEMRIVFRALLDRSDTIVQASDPEWTRSNRHTGLRRLDLTLARGRRPYGRA